MAWPLCDAGKTLSRLSDAIYRSSTAERVTVDEWQDLSDLDVVVTCDAAVYKYDGKLVLQSFGHSTVHCRVVVLKQIWMFTLNQSITTSFNVQSFISTDKVRESRYVLTRRFLRM